MVINLELEGVGASALVDTGSECTVCSVGLYNKVKKCLGDTINMYKIPDGVTFSAVNRRKIDVIGYHYLNVCNSLVRVYVMNGLNNFDMILGDDFLHATNAELKFSLYRNSIVLNGEEYTGVKQFGPSLIGQICEITQNSTPDISDALLEHFQNYTLQFLTTTQSHCPQVPYPV